MALKHIFFYIYKLHLSEKVSKILRIGFFPPSLSMYL